MTLRNVLLTAHILAAIVTIGWLLTTALVAPMAIRRGDLPVLHHMGAVASKVGPAASLVLLLGIWLVVRADDGIEFSDGWVGAAILLFIIAIVNGSVFIAGAEKAAGAKIAAGQPANAEASRVALLGAINAVIVIVLVYLMVAKPGGY